MKILQRFSAGVLLEGVREVSARFLVPVILCVVMAGLIRLRPLEPEALGRILAVAQAGVLWFIGARLFAESRGLPERMYYIWAAAGFAPVAAYIAWMPLPMYVTAFCLLEAALLLGLFVAPYLRRGVVPEAMWSFVYHLISHVIYCLVTVGVLSVGLLAIVASIRYLFGWDIWWVYEDIAIINGVILLPLLVMMGIPKHFDAVMEFPPKGVRYSLCVIVLSLALVYAVILHAYIIKIMVEWSLPKGLAASMVLGYGAVGMAAFAMNYPAVAQHLRIMRWFDRHFMKCMLAPLGLLAAGIAVRVGDYGVTEDRYVLMLGFVWLLLATMVGMFRKERFLPYAPIGLVALLALGSVGPWGVVGLSTHSQMARLEHALEENGLLVNERAVRAAKAIGTAQEEAIGELIHYIVRTGKGAALKPWFADMPASNVAQAQRHRDYNAAKIAGDLGIGYRSARKTYGAREEEEGRFFYFNHAAAQTALDVRGFDFMIDGFGLPMHEKGEQKWQRKWQGPGLAEAVELAFDTASGRMEVRVGQRPPVTLDVHAMLAALKKLPEPKKPAVEHFVLEGRQGSLRVRVAIQSITGSDAGGVVRVSNMHVRLLLVEM